MSDNMSAEDTSGEQTLSASAGRVAEELRRLGLTSEVIELPASTRTALEAAAAIGCEVAQIAKSLVFRAVDTDRPVLVVASGANRVDVDRVASRLGEPVRQADPEWVRQTTGFAIGGIPPVAHRTPPVVLIDGDLFRLEALWAAGGTPHAVFRVGPAELVRISGGTVVRVRSGAG
ncbi:MAG: YbaK/EbsC family protein [Candidatus Dormibacteria bacterium]